MRTLKWNYKGWKNYSTSPWSQTDWNQTLMTKINEASIGIHVKNLLSPATHIKIHKSLISLIKDLEYFRELNDGDLIIGKYKMFVDDNMQENEIIVFDKADADHEAPIKIIIENLYE